ncbi:GNAT family N-acetyltransferase [Maribacter sp. 2210JD10-5]|uniref:GNAT family N-acetyltransferase n=1 Tax=Maribacter sp. 2210JD10-5 TaxID=3386272 RepID=UPI0039BC2F2B
MKVEFEIATIEYIPKLLEMMRGFNAVDNYSFNPKITEQNLTDFLSNESLGRLWLISVEDKPIGYVVLTFGFSFEYGGRDAFIDELFIKERFRGKGIGTKTMEFILTEAKRLHINAIHLEVEKHNNANRLYKKLGFNSTNRELFVKRLTD